MMEPDRRREARQELQDVLVVARVVQQRHLPVMNELQESIHQTKSALKAARDDEKTAFKEAKDKWVKQKCGHIDGHYHHQFHTAKEAWNAISDLVRGFDSAQQVSPTRLRKFGSRTEFCTTDEEEAEAREAHFKDLLERAEPSKMKAGIENDVPQPPSVVRL